MLLLLPITVFAPALGHGFVFDDRDFLVHAPLVGTPGGLVRGFVEPYWSVAGVDAVQPYYRPLGVTAFTALRLLGGGAAWPFHLASCLVHGACAVALARLARRLGAAPTPAVLGGLLFALHPAQTEAVAWATCLTELLATFCVLGAALAWAARRPAAVAAWLLTGTLCKESAFAGALVLAAIEAFRGRSRRMLAAAGLATLAALAMRLAALGWPEGISAPAPAVTTSGASAQPTPLDLAAWLGHQALRLLVPLAAMPFPEPAEPGGAADPLHWLQIAAALGLTAALARLLLRHRTRAPAEAAALGLALVLAGIGISLASGDRSRPPLADRFLHLPLAGAGLAGAWAIARAGRGARLAAAAFTLAGAAGVTAALPDWRDDDALFLAALRDAPDSSVVYAGRAQCLLERAQRHPPLSRERRSSADQAIGVLRQGIARTLGRPYSSRFADDQLRSGLGHALFVRGDLCEAERIYREVLAEHPGSLAARLGLAAVFGTRGEAAWLGGRDAEAERCLLAAQGLYREIRGRHPWSLTSARSGAERVECLLLAAGCR